MTDKQSILKAEEIIRKLEKKEETINKGNSAAQVLGERLSDCITTFKAAKDSNATIHQLADYGRYVIDAYEDLHFMEFISKEQL
jgi:hypothetical protein